jgi:hypothetical protein
MPAKEIEMSTNRCSRLVFSVFAAVLTLALSAPLAVNADEVVIGEDEAIALAPVTAPVVAVTSVDAVQAAALAAQRALLTGDIGSMQEDRLLAIVAAAPSWDATSGYRSVEASRAAASALLAPIATLSWDETSGYGAVEASRATIGHPAAAMSLDYLPVALERGTPAESPVLWIILHRDHAVSVNPLVAAAMAWDATSGYGAVEASRADR